MNLFSYRCPACHALYQDLMENGLTKLVHRGLNSSGDKSPLPTSDCIPNHDYVAYEPCGHCCPDVFASCRACKLHYEGALDRPGRPTKIKCDCHYCIETAIMVHIDAKDATRTQRIPLAKLYRQIASAFDIREIKEILYELIIDPEELAWETKTALARELTLFCERTRRLPELLAICKRDRPNLGWQWSV